MKAYKVKDLTTGAKTERFRYMKDMCEFYGWKYNTFKKRKHESGLPIGQRTKTGYYVITEIEIRT